MQHHFNGFIQKCLDYFFISNSLQESVKTKDTLAAFSTDHSPTVLSLYHLKEFHWGRGLWKFNKSLIKNENYRKQIKTLIKNVLDNLALKLNKIYKEKTNGNRLRSKCDWYEHGEKSSNFCLNLEKSRAAENQIRKILIGNMEVNNEKNINNELYYKNLFNEGQHLSEHHINKF